jgi:hypothetical protein
VLRNETENSKFKIQDRVTRLTLWGNYGGWPRQLLASVAERQEAVRAIQEPFAAISDSGSSVFDLES